ncbi:deoxyribonuclease-1-like [Cebidichthys violaceus]|uniref:deoxyribonuclease-1-like n=1 Tax=Cebidichthys violaceus TaxID=271503 RepID=UPI0035C9893A
MRWVCALGLLSALLHLSTSLLLLGAFNIQTFGNQKSSNPALMNIISTIVCRYDIVLIQEVRDNDQTVTNRLRTAVNGVCGQHRYDYTASNPLGPNVHKEKYAFFYRTTTVAVVRSAIYNDVPYGFYGRFSRPPFIVEFTSEQAVVRNFVLIPQHTSPTAAVQQIDALYDVATYVINQWNTNNIVLLGDFNAGGTYVTPPRWQQIRLFTDPQFHWLINNAAATSVRTGLPYDRIVVTGAMNTRVVPNSAGVYNFMLAFGLTLPQALAVSDHFPVEVTLA